MTFHFFSSPSYTTMPSRENKIIGGTCQCQFRLICCKLQVKWSALTNLNSTVVSQSLALEIEIGWVASLTLLSTRSLCDENLPFIRSFHSSVFFLREALPQCRTLHIPLLCFHVWTQKDVDLARGHQGARWAESGGLTRCELKWPSFGCLKREREWMASIFISILGADWLCLVRFFDMWTKVL
jgi:hypothetical protein